ncbi:MAG: helix-turn-helix transcriptional regulator [Rhodoferax sp.]|nr:helix-turn-helix transcriptional regulator [Rhodoferax sp.]MDP3650921.1 helix-turn-helix transcriptional regulator [Rhodoferax sp.]
MSVHQRIKEAREQRGLNYQQFGDAVGVSRGAVQQWEKGVTAPTRKNQPAVAKFLGITVAELMTDDAVISSSNQPLAPVNIGQTATENGAIPIEQLMAGLARYLMEMDDDARHSAADVLRNLTHKPENHARAAAMFTTAFQLGARKVA